jgi:hypothetical protein
MKSEDKTFTITCTMKERWIPHFLGMLGKMEQLGSQGSSRPVGIFADGDGDFRPKFKWEEGMPEEAKPIAGEKSGFFYDAG